MFAAPDTSDTLTGIYTGAMILWLIVLWRFMVKQTPLENRSNATNNLVNHWWLRQNTVMALSIILIFGPRHLLRANGLMDEQFGFLILCIGGAAMNICATILLHMKDILEQKKHKVAWVYLMIPTIFVFYMGSR